MCNRRSVLAALILSIAFPVTGLGAQWVADVEKEWKANGSRWFESVAADEPHATIRLKDTASREKVGAFEVWMLVDGARVRSFPDSTPLRLAPGAHCIRVEMVAAAQKYQGNVGKYWPWLQPTEEVELSFTRDDRGFSSQYRKVVITTKGLLDQKRLDYDAKLPGDTEAAYNYCMMQVGGVTGLGIGGFPSASPFT